MHSEPEVLEAEFGKIVAIDGVRIKVVFLEFFSEALPFLVFSPEEAGREQEGRGDDGGDHIDCDVISKTCCCDKHKERIKDEGGNKSRMALRGGERRAMK